MSQKIIIWQSANQTIILCFKLQHINSAILYSTVLFNKIDIAQTASAFLI